MFLSFQLWSLLVISFLSIVISYLNNIHHHFNEFILWSFFDYCTKFIGVQNYTLDYLVSGLRLLNNPKKDSIVEVVSVLCPS
jgi:hypothetical protein